MNIETNNKNITTTKEIWVPCIASNNYEVSNLGRCKRKDTGKILRPNKKGNYVYQLYDNNFQRNFQAKYLIYESFNGLVPKGSYVHLKDNDRGNLCLNNMFLFTPAHIL